MAERTRNTKKNVFEVSVTYQVDADVDGSEALANRDSLLDSSALPPGVVLISSKSTLKRVSV